MLESRRLMEQTGKRGMSLSAAEGALLGFFIRQQSYQRAVEIGCFAGYSSLWIADALAGGELHTIESNPQHAQLAQQVFALYQGASRIHLHCAPAKDVLQQLAMDAPYDFVFIDANKAAYPEYLEWAAENLRAGGMVVADNSLLYNEIGKDSPERVSRAQWQGMREFHRMIADRTRFDSCFIPSSEGMTIAIKR